MSDHEAYRIMLQKLSRNTDGYALKEMMHLVAVKKSRREKMDSALEVFEYLEEIGQLSADNVDYLIDLLEQLDRTSDANLVKDYRYNQSISTQTYKGQQRDITNKTVAQPDDDVDAAHIDLSLNDAFEFLKDSLGMKWREFARELRLTTTDIQAIEHDYPRDLKEQSYQALVLWHKKQGSNATLDDLIRHLRKKKFNQMANDVSTKFLVETCK